MTRPIPEQASSAAVNTALLLALFEPGNDNPISHTIAQILAAGTPEWRGEWSDLAGQTLNVGNLVSHSNRYYIVRVQHVRTLQGPDSDSTNFALLNNWAGNYGSNDYYHSGSITLFRSRLWVNSDNVNPADPNPDDSANTKWHRLSPYSAGEIIDLIEAETGNDRLDASRLRNHPQASTSAPGDIQIASTAQIDAGTDNATAVTPAGAARRTGPRVTAAERAATTPETSVRQYSPSDIVDMIAEHASSGGLSTSEVEALFAVWARVSDTSRIPAAKLDTDVVLSAELTAAIAGFRSEAQINALINTAIDGLDAITNSGAYAAATAYEAGAFVRHGGNGTQASYLCISDAPANNAASEPGVGANWRNFWYRVGYEDGPPNALVNLTLAGRTVTATREGGTNPIQLNFPVTDRTERGERITNRALASGSTSAEARPIILTNPLSVVHGEGANSILSNVTGNDVTVAAGLYAVVMEVEVDPGATSGATRDRTFRFDIRDASDDSVIARSTSPALFGTRANRVSALALLNLNADTAVNHLIERSGDLEFAANFTITYFRWGENEDTGVGNVKTVEIGRYMQAADQSQAEWEDTGIAAPTDIDPEDTFLFSYEEDLLVANLAFSGRQLLAATRHEAGTTDNSGSLKLSTGVDEYSVTRNAAGNFVIAAFNDQLYGGQSYIFEILRAPRGERGLPGGWGPPTDLGLTTFDLTGAAAEIPLTDSNGNAIVCPASGDIRVIVTVPTLGLVGVMEWALAADLREATRNDALTAGVYTNDDNEIIFHADMQSGASTGNEILVQHIPGAAEQTDSGVSIIPAIAEFNLTGDLNPPTGSIAGNVLSYETAINQSGHASAARIVGFAGTDREPSAVTVLANITDLHRESGTITIPAGVSLAAEGDVYTVRLEVYTPGETPATDQPRVYKDERITARAVAATVHFGRLLSTQGAADVDFANDISTAGAVAGTWTVTGIPDDSNLYRIYWAVPQSLDQPTAWSTSGFPVTSTIGAAVARTIGGVAYNIYLTAADAPFDNTGNGTPYVVST